MKIRWMDEDGWKNGMIEIDKRETKVNDQKKRTQKKSSPTDSEQAGAEGRVSGCTSAARRLIGRKEVAKEAEWKGKGGD